MFNRYLPQLLMHRKFVLTMIFGLLMAQWLVFSHVHEQNASAPDSFCFACVVGEHFSDTLINSQIVFSSQATFQIINTVLNDLVLQQTFFAFKSRAPPVLF